MENKCRGIGFASLMAGLALAMVAAANASRPVKQDNTGRANLYQQVQYSPFDSGSGTDGTLPSSGGTGGTGTDTSLYRGRDSAPPVPFGYPGTGGSNDSIGSPTGGTGTNSQGMGGSGGNPGLDSLQMSPPVDPGRSKDSIGASEWNERG